MFMFSRKAKAGPRGADGRRAYIVGDVHGRLDLLDALIDRIHSDLDARPKVDTLLVFVGDLIDRGPDSAGVVERLRTYRRDGVRPVFLLGNHEEVVLRILAGDAPLIEKWRWFGGSETLQSYGVDPDRVKLMSDDEALATVRAAIPAEHAGFFRDFGDTLRFGDYLIVHAGVRPGVPLERQTQQDLRWIREPFLGDRGDHGFVVVHGHTITNAVEELPNRIGIDTGAYATGRLTALAIEGEERWFLDTADVETDAL
jgi:serine/threonine protein phosphatase 1